MYLFLYLLCSRTRFIPIIQAKFRPEKMTPSGYHFALRVALFDGASKPYHSSGDQGGGIGYEQEV